jgi:hypothetical protein
LENPKFPAATTIEAAVGNFSLVIGIPFDLRKSLSRRSLIVVISIGFPLNRALPLGKFLEIISFLDISPSRSWSKGAGVFMMNEGELGNQAPWIKNPQYQ